jgi:5'-phosphate synthase pdxT subunit
MPLVIGVLALQGAFAKHAEALQKLKVETLFVRSPEDLQRCQGLIIPGGESTAISSRLTALQLWEPLRTFALHKPLFGTCAGLILMAKNISNHPVPSLGLLDLSVERNGFGRQFDSFSTSLKMNNGKKLEALFIRAPRIRTVNKEVEILASLQGEAVFVRQSIHMGTTFHPELTEDLSVHRYFLKMVAREADGHSANW